MVTRQQVLSYRISVQGLDRGTDDPLAMPVFDLGFQNTPPGSAIQAMAARLDDPLSIQSIPPGSLAIAWTVRGAPHLHRSKELPSLARALFPVSDADASARMGIWARALEKSDVRSLAALRETAETLRDVVTSPTSKGEASRKVTERIRPELVRWCPRCQSRHVFEDLFRYGALQAGLKLDVEKSPLELVPIPEWRVPERSRDVQRIIRAYLRLHGPAGPSEAAAFLGTKPALLQSAWPEGLREVSVEGVKSWIDADHFGDLLVPPEPPAVRLIPPSDPYLQARDRGLLVPDRNQRSEVWKAISNPGVVLIGTDIAGTWRARTKGRAVSLNISLFYVLSTNLRKQIETEAERIALVRGQRLQSVELSV